jgi:hypothetical protein
MLHRLLEHRDGAGAERVVHALVLDAARDDVHRDVPRLGVSLQVVEHRPAVLHRQAHVEDDRVGLVLVREREALVAADGDDSLEAPVARDLELRLREVLVVLDDQHHAVTVGDRRAVVIDRRLVRKEHRRIEVELGQRRLVDGRQVVGRLVLRRLPRQVERELRALARLGRHVNLAAEQPRDLP